MPPRLVRLILAQCFRGNGSSELLVKMVASRDRRLRICLPMCLQLALEPQDLPEKKNNTSIKNL